MKPHSAVHLDVRLPSGGRARDAWEHRTPWFPASPSRRWEDVYRTWFGNADRPQVNLHLMGNCPPAWDAEIRRCYEALWHEGRNGGLADWDSAPRSAVAKLLLLDQFPRHMFRGRGEAFATDPHALALVEKIAASLEAGTPFHLEEAIMMALPWVHQESVEHLNRAIAWHGRLVEAARGTPYFSRTLFGRYGAERHLPVLQRFGRYPHRNSALGRTSSPEEQRHLKHAAQIWEKQQSSASGSWRYRLHAAKFLVEFAFYLIGVGEGRAGPALFLSRLR